MTSQSPRIYIYKITFEEVLYYYYGVHKERKYNEYYMGSPVVHKWCWELYTPKKQILELFDFTDEGWMEAQEIETRLIKPVYNTDKWCLNESCGGKISLNVRRETGRKVGKKIYEEKKGIHSLSFEERSEMGKTAGKICYEEGKGIHAETTEQRRKRGQKLYKDRKGIHSQTFEERSELGKRNGQKLYEEGKGIFGMTLEEKLEVSRKTGKKHYENKTGIFSLTTEKRSDLSREIGQKNYEKEIGIFSLNEEQKFERNSKGGKKSSRIMNAQKWECTETGYVANPGNLSKYQKRNGIDTSKRRRIA
jgi:hypothetical protein